MPKGASSSEDTVRACRSPSTVLNPAIFDDDAFFSAAWRLNSDFGNEAMKAIADMQPMDELWNYNQHLNSTLQAKPVLQQQQQEQASRAPVASMPLLSGSSFASPFAQASSFTLVDLLQPAGMPPPPSTPPSSAGTSTFMFEAPHLSLASLQPPCIPADSNTAADVLGAPSLESDATRKQKKGKGKRAREPCSDDEDMTYQPEPLAVAGRRVSRNTKAKLRREKNKLAARKCRQKKQDTVLDTESRLAALQSEINAMRARVGQSRVLLDKHTEFIARLQARIASCDTSTRTTLTALLHDACQACGLAPADLAALCDGGAALGAAAGACAGDGAANVSIVADAEGEANDYVDAHGRSLAYVRACALVCGASITTGHNAVSERNCRSQPGPAPALF